MLIFPFVAEAILASIIPAGSYYTNENSNSYTSHGTNNLAVTNYGSGQILPYYLVDNTGSIAAILTKFYVNSASSLYRSGVTLLQLTTNTVSDYILSLRKSSVNNFIYKYWFGFSLDYSSGTTLYATIYYNTLAFHSSAVGLNEVSNMLLNLISGNDAYTLTTYNNPILSTSSVANSSTN